jgi:YihY family inner membrane protein
MSIITALLRRFDKWQQSHTVSAVLVATYKKAGDDRSGTLVALLTYYAFVSLFPMLLLLVTGLGFLVAHDDALRQRLLDSALADFPVLGSQLRDNVRGISGSTLAIGVGVVGAVWGSLGFAQMAQHAIDQVWNVPVVRRPGFFPRIARGAMLLGVIAVSGIGGPMLADLGWLGAGAVGRSASILAAAIVNIGSFWVAYRVLTDRRAPTRSLLPGALVAGAGWTALQIGGTRLVDARLREASDLYGTFAVVLGLLAWLAISAQLSVLSAEFNVVLARRLWPRALFPPPLTPSDRKVLNDLVAQEVRRPDQSLDVDFEAVPAPPDIMENAPALTSPPRAPASARPRPTARPESGAGRATHSARSDVWAFAHLGTAARRRRDNG